MTNHTNEKTPSERPLIRIVADFGGRRKLYDRRVPPETEPSEERRSGIDRRSGFDRRSSTNGNNSRSRDRRMIPK